MLGRSVVVLLVFIVVCFVSGPEVHADEPDKDEAAGGSLPVINITIDESRGTIEDMNNSEDHSKSCYGTLSITVPDGFRYSGRSDMSLGGVTDLDMSIHGRGNSTWKQAKKKPYKIKLEKKADLLGLGQSKHYVLLANAMDSTLLRNRLTSYLAESLEMEYTPEFLPVDVYMNGEYLGNYLLSGGVRVGENRVDIEAPDKDDVDPEDITGGYLVQGGQQTDSDSPSYFATERRESFANHTPNFDPEDGGYENEAQKEYIRNYLQLVEDALFSPDYTGADGKRYSERMDLTSAASYWLIQQASVNPDAFVTGSTYLYKKKDTEAGEGKLYWGPVWDFDVAWGATSSDWDPEEEEGETEPGIKDYDGFCVGTCWADAMLSDPEFRKEIYAQWPTVRDTLLDAIEPEGLIDAWCQEMEESQAADFEKWHPGRDNLYQKHVDILKEWIRERVSWMDAHLSELETAISRLTLKVWGQPDRILYQPTGREFYLENLGTVEKEGFLFLGWLDEKGKTVTEDVKADHDRILTAELIQVEGVSYSCRTAYMDSCWTQGSDESLIFDFVRSADNWIIMRLFTGISVDGKKVDSYDCTAKEGCLLIGFPPEFLKTLKIGKHTLTAEFLDGACTWEFTILEETEPKIKPINDGENEMPAVGTGDKTPEVGADNETSTADQDEKKQDTDGEKVPPQTGDDSPIELWISLFILSLAGTAGVLTLKRRWR